MKNLLKALHKALGEMSDPKRNSTNPHFRNRYADLAAVLESVSDPLQRHGLVLVQLTEAGSPPKLRTQLHHVESGEMMESTIDLVAEKATPQGVMACCTYYRRLAVKTMFGLAEVDDDGNEASGAVPKPTARPAAAPKPATKVVEHDPFETPSEAVVALNAVKTKAELDVCRVRIVASKFLPEEMAEIKKAGEAAKERCSNG